MGCAVLLHNRRRVNRRRFLWTEGTLASAVVVEHRTQWGGIPERDGERDFVVDVEVTTNRGVERHALVFFSSSAHAALPLGAKVQAIVHSDVSTVLFPIEQGIQLIPR